jgi:hypothetical protein
MPLAGPVAVVHDPGLADSYLAELIRPARKALDFSPEPGNQRPERSPEPPPRAGWSTRPPTHHGRTAGPLTAEFPFARRRKGA